MLVAASNALPQCSDDDLRTWPTAFPKSARQLTNLDCRSREFKNTALCSKVVGILNATCNELGNEAMLAEQLLNVQVLPEHKLASIRTNGVYQRPAELAALLMHLAREVRSREAPLRFLSTNANNGWTAVLAAAFLYRTHRGGLTASAYNDLKWEWACDEPMRQITRQAGISWRSTKALDPAAEAALMSYHPQARSPTPSPSPSTSRSRSCRTIRRHARRCGRPPSLTQRS